MRRHPRHLSLPRFGPTPRLTPPSPPLPRSPERRFNCEPCSIEHAEAAYRSRRSAPDQGSPQFQPRSLPQTEHQPHILRDPNEELIVTSEADSSSDDADLPARPRLDSGEMPASYKSKMGRRPGVQHTTNVREEARRSFEELRERERKSFEDQQSAGSSSTSAAERPGFSSTSHGSPGHRRKSWDDPAA